MNAFDWPEGKRGAVSLTYDDALPVHYERVAPLLEDHGLRATFYTNVLSLGANPEAWPLAVTSWAITASSILVARVRAMAGLTRRTI